MFTTINQSITLAVYHLSSQNIWTESFAILLSDGLMVVAVCMYVFFMFPLRKEGAYSRTVFHDLLPVAVTAVVALLVKSALLVARPYAVLHFVPFVPATDPLASFPSLHVALIAAFATTLWFAHRRLGRLMIFLVPLVMLGRIAVGVHWFTDVLAGAYLGWQIALLVRYLEQRFGQNVK
jgi:undecaprenyl-diphosphatase